MAWNNPYFPVNYQPFQMYQPQNPQMMTPPTIRAEIVQVDGEQAAAVFRVMDELMRDIRHANRRVYDGVLKKIGAA